MTPDQFLAKLKKDGPEPVYLFLGPDAFERDRCRRALPHLVDDHAGAGREMRAGVDDDEAPRRPVHVVAVEHERTGRGHGDRADLVQHETMIDLGRHGACALLEQVGAAWIERALAELEGRHPISIVPTFLGAHAFPAELGSPY